MYLSLSTPSQRSLPFEQVRYALKITSPLRRRPVTQSIGTLPAGGPAIPRSRNRFLSRNEDAGYRVFTASANLLDPSGIAQAPACDDERPKMDADLDPGGFRRQAGRSPDEKSCLFAEKSFDSPCLLLLAQCCKRPSNRARMQSADKQLVLWKAADFIYI